MIGKLKHLLNALRIFFTKRLTVSADLIDATMRDYSHRIDQEEIDRYHEVVAVDAQLETLSREGIHPMFYTRISWKITEQFNTLIDRPVDPRILESIVHQSEDIIIENRLRGPCDLSVRSDVWMIEPHKLGTRMTMRQQYFSGDMLMATQYTRGLFLHVRCMGKRRDRGPLPPTEVMADEQIVWQRTFRVDEQLPYRYAENTGIDADIHTDPAFARKVGLPGNILQGTCTFSRAVNHILQAHGGGATSSVWRVSAKFTGMVLPPALLRVRILEKKPDAIYFDVIHQDGQSVIKGGQIFFEHTK